MRTPTSPLGIDIDLTYDYLEERFEDDCKCEANHNPENPDCSGDVAARFFSCSSPNGYLICSKSYRFTIEQIAKNGHFHDVCRKRIAECWVVNPA